MDAPSPHRASALRWIFGYGSLIWRPSFSYAARRRAALHGWARRFYQGSTDHRGIPGAPGRVVTLLPEPHTTTTGLAFALTPTEHAAVLAQLDVREQGGYSQEIVEVVDLDTHLAFEALVYRATPENPEYLGPESDDAIARQIARAHGPSGPNSEYLLQLEAALLALDAPDPHVTRLADALRALSPR